MARRASDLFRRSAMDLARPIFVWGAPRSGTHLLFDILSLHPAVACPTTRHRWKKGLWGSMNWGDETPPALRGRPAPYEGFQRFWLDVGVEYDSIGLYDRTRMTPELIARIRRRYSELRTTWRWNGGPGYRILDKCPTYVLMVDAIDAVFPDSRHVFLIRDPRSVLNSLLRLYRFPAPGKGRGRIDETGFATGLPPGHEAHRGEPLVERLVWQIGALHELAEAHGRRWPGRVLRVHYESLLSDAHGTAQSVFEALGLAPWPELADLIPARFPDYAPPWPGGPATEPFGLKRCWQDEETEQLEGAERLAVGLGYRPGRPGALDTASAAADRSPAVASVT